MLTSQTGGYYPSMWLLPINCFLYRAQLPCSNPSHTSATLFCNAISWSVDMCTGNMTGHPITPLMDFICPRYSSSLNVAHTNPTDAISYFTESNHFHGSLVRFSTLMTRLDITSVDKLYLLIKWTKLFSQHFLPGGWKSINAHIWSQSASTAPLPTIRLIPFNIASSSAKLICCMSFHPLGTYMHPQWQICLLPMTFWWQGN